MGADLVQSKRKAAARAAVVLGAAQVAAVSLTAACAADLPVKARPLTAPVANWTQFYAGGGLGFDFATGRSNLTPVGGGPDLFSLDGLQGADLGLSVFAGFDVQVAPRFVVGGFVDYDWSRQRTTASASSPFFGQSLSAALPSLDQGWTIGGRAGFLVTPDILLYGLAGYSEMRINNWNLNYVILGGGPSFTVQESGLTSHGYTVGAGAEYRLASNVSLRGEYRYVALGRNTTVDPLGAVWTTDLSEHVVRIGAAYRFGQFGGPATASVAPALNPTWTGVYVGAGIGGDVITPHVAGSFAGVLDFDASGLGGADVGGTFTIGYDRQVAPRWVLGAFGLIDAGTNGGAKVNASGGGVAISSDLAAVKWGWTVGGRVGYLVAPETLVYLLGGYSGTTAQSISYNFLGFPGTAPTREYHGATFGGGFERFFTDSISARAEYRVTHLGARDDLASDFMTSLSAGGTVHTLRGVLAYHLPAP
ncbi:outer membrane beta-barrel protein [Bradyrhizobium liaoningense]|nr:MULTISPECIES: outer membrane beta-barrel protein [Bradyrhizobium]MBR0878439.1 outer membrane beta-barrel protein [Bradyrhizobium liaoningense]MBR0940767.1 outer membrane beta-barrel protein [Bradyrhizobium liaoningense]MBR0998047.1 outer membrane beta-barrel protein [Bradyrhizobium liaoningense]MBR1031711.1 outer membrane beta-barrel protein [Bradyrhizobium liaoningense]MBR1069099.1 outer membrane beta-barrel protein [Bradyrhizobium liaoningense]